LKYFVLGIIIVVVAVVVIWFSFKKLKERSLKPHRLRRH